MDMFSSHYWLNIVPKKFGHDLRALCLRILKLSGHSSLFPNFLRAHSLHLSLLFASK